MNKVVLVTGSSRGIGKATIVEFAKRGYDVVINYIEEEYEALVLEKEIKSKYGVQTLVVKCDVSKESEVKYMVNEAIKKFSKIDVLVNNAGIVIDRELFDRTLEEFENTVKVNLLGTWLVSKIVSKYMLESKQGKIINISSTNGINTLYPTSIDYDATKAGIISMTKNFAIELAPYINVNSVAPGWVNTDMNKDQDIDLVKEESEQILLKRFAEPEDIAKVIYFLASEDANYINGEVIKVDGGLKL